jgi:hypothetical protein
MISLNKLPELPTGWTRVVGMLAFIIGVYDIVSGRANFKPFIKASIFVRLGFTVGASLLVIAGEMPPAALVLGIVDGLGAVWTILALGAERRVRR